MRGALSNERPYRDVHFNPRQLRREGATRLDTMNCTVTVYDRLPVATLAGRLWSG